MNDPAGNASARTTRSFTAYHINADFNDGQLPAGMEVAGAAHIKASGGANNTGFVEINFGEHSVLDSLNVGDALGGGDCLSLTAWYKLYMGHNSLTPADGYQLQHRAETSLPSFVEGTSASSPGLGQPLPSRFWRS